MKNIKVYDKNNKFIGMTYPKRARGLVKSGRAEFVMAANQQNSHDIESCKIKLLKNFIPPAVQISEELNMSKIINFNAREFKIDSSCENNVCSRMFVSTPDDNSAEMFEVGDFEWNWSQIKCEKSLSKNTDYIFQFMLKGGFLSKDESLPDVMCIIFKDNNWEDRFCFPIGNNGFKPVVSKADADGELLRVFKIPFSTHESEKTTILLISNHTKSQFFPVFEDAFYEKLEDMSLEQICEKFGGKNKKSRYNVNLQNAHISEKAFDKIIEMSAAIGDFAVNLQNAIIYKAKKNSEPKKDGFEDDVIKPEVVEETVYETENHEKSNSEFDKFAVMGLKAGYKALKEIYEKTPDGSFQKEGLKAAVEEMEKQLKEMGEEI